MSSTVRFKGHGAIPPEPDLGPEQETQGQGRTRSTGHDVDWFGGIGQ